MAETGRGALVVDMCEDGNRYAKVHRAGCRQAIDPEPVDAATILDALVAVWEEYADATDSELTGYVSPCARDVPLR